MVPADSGTAARLTVALAAPVAAALVGRWRIVNLKSDLEPDWRRLVDFGAALRIFMQSAGHDAASLATMTALAGDVAPLVLGAAPEGAPARALFANLATAPAAFGDPAAATTRAERTRLDDLRGQVMGAEWLLQAEMKRLARQESEFGAWVSFGVSGLLLALLGRAGERTAAERMRRRTLEIDPRFAMATRVGVVLLYALALGLVLVPLAARLARLLHSAALNTGS
jgi:hypothetical protein